MIKTLRLEDVTIMFETLDDLVNSLKDEDYEVILKFKKKGKIKSDRVRL